LHRFEEKFELIATSSAELVSVPSLQLWTRS
jgi:hypothetical protein